MKKRIKLQGLLIFLAMITLVFYSRNLFRPASKKLAEILLEILGVLMISLGYFLRISARGMKAEFNPDGKTLISKGPYALLRNPMYFGTLLIGLGVVLFLLKWWVVFVFLAVYLVIYIPQINREEEILDSRFSQEFQQYCRMTPKFFPNLKTILRISAKEYLQIKFIWIKKELSSLVIMLVSIAGIKIWILLKK